MPGGQENDRFFDYTACGCFTRDGEQALTGAGGLPAGSSGSDGQAQSDCLQHRRQGFKRRVPLGRQGAIQTFPFDAGGLGDIGHAVGLGDRGAKR